jgi:histidinol-phosphatase (PHP family)
VLFPTEQEKRSKAMPFSHHSHSGQFCGHATNTLEEVIQTVISKKMEVFAMTEHMPRDERDFYPEEVHSLATREEQGS